MKMAFYPGCSLEGMANDYARSVVSVFEKLEIGFHEIRDWSCCGATAAYSLNDYLSVAFPARNLYAAEQMGMDIVAPCALCFNRLKHAQKAVKKKLADVPWPVTGDIDVHDMTRFLSRPDMLKLIRGRVAAPLKGLKIICYYGCQSVRPPRLTDAYDYENPMTMETVLAALGAEILDWSYKSTCCGAGIGAVRKDIRDSLTTRLLKKAAKTGTHAIAVSCPLCQTNLDTTRVSGAYEIPVFYFTELIQLAFSEKGEAPPFGQHFRNPMPVLKRAGIIK